MESLLSALIQVQSGVKEAKVKRAKQIKQAGPLRSPTPATQEIRERLLAAIGEAGDKGITRASLDSMFFLTRTQTLFHLQALQAHGQVRPLVPFVKPSPDHPPRYLLVEQP